jgi:hypothetical protein
MLRNRLGLAARTRRMGGKAQVSIHFPMAALLTLVLTRSSSRFRWLGPPSQHAWEVQLQRPSSLVHPGASGQYSGPACRLHLPQQKVIFNKNSC